MNENSSTKEFDLGALLNITTGRYLTNFDDIFDVLSFIFDCNVEGEFLGTYGPIAKEFILKLYPELNGVGEYEYFSSFEQIEDFISDKKNLLGSTRELRQMTLEDSKSIEGAEQILNEIKAKKEEKAKEPKIKRKILGLFKVR